MLCEQKPGSIPCLHIRMTDLFAASPYDTQTSTRTSVLEFSSLEFVYVVIIVVSHMKWKKNFLGNADDSGAVLV